VGVYIYRYIHMHICICVYLYYTYASIFTCRSQCLKFGFVAAVACFVAAVVCLCTYNTYMYPYTYIRIYILMHVVCLWREKLGLVAAVVCLYVYDIYMYSYTYKRMYTCIYVVCLRQRDPLTHSSGNKTKLHSPETHNK